MNKQLTKYLFVSFLSFSLLNSFCLKAQENLENCRNIVENINKKPEIPAAKIAEYEKCVLIIASEYSLNIEDIILKEIKKFDTEKESYKILKKDSLEIIKTISLLNSNSGIGQSHKDSIAVIQKKHDENIIKILESLNALSGRQNIINALQLRNKEKANIRSLLKDAYNKLIKYFGDINEGGKEKSYKEKLNLLS